MDQYIGTTIKQNVKSEYKEHIMKRVLRVKEVHIQKMKERKDMHQLLVVQDKHGAEVAGCLGGQVGECDHLSEQVE